ncbi:hypothetical protein NUM3379_33620 [Kineococcus sp. NUM-3379]
MRILIAADTYFPDVNGASYFAQRFAAGLVARGHEVHVVAPSRDRRHHTLVRDGVTEHRVRSLPVPGHPGFRGTPPGIRRYLAREVARVRPDVVHVQGHFTLGRTTLRVARALGVPTVATNHFMPDNLVHYLHLPRPLERAVEAVAWRDFARVFNTADVVTAPTPFAAALAQEKGVRAAVLPISCGMDFSRFSPANPGAGFRRRLGLGDRLTITFVGRLDLEKNVDQLVRALPLVRRSVDAQLLVVGTGRERENLVRLAERTGVGEHVTFAGFVADEDLPAAYAASDVCVNPGVAELQSIVTLEAMASGKPVFGANARALPLLVHDGVNGHLFEPGDVAGLAERLVRVLTDDALRQRMGAESLRIVAAHDAGATLDAFEERYARLVPAAVRTAVPAVLPGPRRPRRSALASPAGTGGTRVDQPA